MVFDAEQNGSKSSEWYKSDTVDTFTHIQTCKAPAYSKHLTIFNILYST